MKNRVVRVSDETWDAAKATAEKEGTTVSAVVRRLLNAYVKAGAAVLVAALAILTLGACGGAEPGAAPTSQSSVQVSVEPSPSASPDVDLSQPGGRKEIVRRVEAGECFSASFGSTAVDFNGWMVRRPEPAAQVAYAEWEATFRAWLDALPPACTDSDTLAIDNMRGVG